MNNSTELPLLAGSLALDFAIGGGLYERHEYYINMERILSSTCEWRIAGLKKRADKLSENERLNFLEFNYPSQWETSFPNELRACTIVSVFSFFESMLDNLCREASIRFHAEYNPSKVKHFRFFCDFLEKHGDIQLSIHDQWKPIENLQELRNGLVHTGMYIGNDELEDKRRQAINAIPGTSWDEYGFLQLTQASCEYAFDSIEAMLQLIRNQVADKWEKKQSELGLEF